MTAVKLELVHKPRQIVGSAVIAAVGQKAPSMLAAILFIVAAVEVPAPPPFFGPYDLSVGISSANLRGIVQNARPDLVHGRADRMHVTMRGVPDAVLVVENVIAGSRAGGGAPAVDDRLYPLP